MSDSQTSLPDAVDVWTETEAAISSLAPGDTYGLYDLLYHAARLLAPVCRFSVCLCDEALAALFVAYRRGPSGPMDPATFPLSDDPVSEVARTGRPYVRNVHGACDAAGAYAPIAAAAACVHLPMRAYTPGGPSVTGVLCITSALEGAFELEAVCALQSLADRAAAVLRAGVRCRACSARFERMEQEAEERRRQVVAMASQFAGMMGDLSRKAQQIRGMVAEQDGELKAAVQGLCRDCHRVATRVTEAPMDLCPGDAHEAAAPEGVRLTDREVEILHLLASGETNAAIADRLYVSVDTVKFHCGNIYRKLGVANRVQAVQAASGYLSSAPS